LSLDLLVHIQLFIVISGCIVAHELISFFCPFFFPYIDIFLVDRKTVQNGPALMAKCQHWEQNNCRLAAKKTNCAAASASDRVGRTKA